MNDFDPNNMSRSKRPKKDKLEPKFSRKSDSKSPNKGFRVLLVVLALAIISFVPVYGMIANQKSSKPQTAVSSSTKRSSTTKSTSSESSESSSESSVSSSSEEESVSSSEAASSEEAASSSSTETAESSSASSSSTTTTAVLGTSQTLYNFAVTHGMTTSQVIALNPGLTVDNYTQYAGTALNIQ
ncbi:peptidoglycan-binding protein LysM [Leuconostoc suionicum]|uniref:peptidoglycan-binding protein LysM n=1 Tax=Leuconostoc suionicum TaxID=1511761 RepID=UPI00233EC77C|nr:peptidoglycan-binding protein LysM [Leuconostoc suionicum]MDC2804893.1 peptidoglycan-binding protein LysM [Leuconostoc suionicum]MDC2822405.1 peptidoglycan-binding protein LysM [Leuconostoc suionicum]